MVLGGEGWEMCLVDGKEVVSVSNHPSQSTVGEVLRGKDVYEVVRNFNFQRKTQINKFLASQEKGDAENDENGGGEADGVNWNNGDGDEHEGAGSKKGCTGRGWGGGPREICKTPPLPQERTGGERPGNAQHL